MHIVGFSFGDANFSSGGQHGARACRKDASLIRPFGGTTCVTRNPYCHSKTIRFVKFAAIAVLFAEYLLAYAIVILVHKSRTLAAPAPGYAGACLLKERPSWGWATPAAFA